MALSFPSNPTVNQIYSNDVDSWRWTGTAWKKYNPVSFPSGTLSIVNGGSATSTDTVIEVENSTLDTSPSSPGIAVSTGGGWGTSLAIPSGDLVGTTAAQTLTNKRIDPRVSSTASATSVTPNVTEYDMYAFTALAAGLTINAPTGTPVDGDRLMFRFLDNGTTRTLTWDSTYTIIGTSALPTATTINKTTYVGCIYNSGNSRWDVVAINTQA